MMYLLQYVPFLCKLYWALCSGAVVVTVLPIPTPQAFKNAVQLSAARGKLWGGRPRALGALEDAAVPQKWFSHFYVLGMVANALLLVIVISTSTTDAAQFHKAISVCSLSLFQVHLMRRAFETLAVMKYPEDSKMHVIAYVYGLSYYLAVPVSLIPESMLTEGFSGWHQHPKQPGQLLEAMLTSWRTAYSQSFWLLVVGTATFALGSTIQCWSHVILARLQRGTAGTKALKSATAYKIPRGGLFEVVSCPHYLGEIVIYNGLLMVTQGQIDLWLINVWVVFNLVLAAGAAHRWYLKQFKNYPRSRSALIPNLYNMLLHMKGGPTCGVLHLSTACCRSVPPDHQGQINIPVPNCS